MRMKKEMTKASMASSSTAIRYCKRCGIELDIMTSFRQIDDGFCMNCRIKVYDDNNKTPITTPWPPDTPYDPNQPWSWFSYPRRGRFWM